METVTGFMIFLFCFIIAVDGRIHRLDLKKDDRKEIQLSTFGFLKKGILEVNVTKFQYYADKSVDTKDVMFGFTLDKSGSSGIASYMEENSKRKCILKNIPDSSDTSVSVVLFRMDLKNKLLTIKKSGDDLNLLDISSSLKRPAPVSRGTYTQNTKLPTLSDKNLIQPPVETKHTDPQPRANQQNKQKTRSSRAVEENAPPPKAVPKMTTPKPKAKKINQDPTKPEPIDIFQDANNSYSFYFAVSILHDQEEGLYNLYFHNCLSYLTTATFDLSIDIQESNDGNYLSAGEIPVGYLYFALFFIYLAVAIFWMVTLRRLKEDVYKIHYLMFALVLVKSLSCLFHAVNMHFIAVEGIHAEAWAILYYIVYLSKGALMFVTIILIGAGWAFIKHVLSDKEKKLFMVVIPLQILDNIAYIILEESEEGQSQYVLWQEIFIFVDLLCCGAILFPVVWSIRHLHDASRTDGKAAISLLKLKLFRQFYILVVCYIYFTRIIVYLIRITVPFQYEWLDQLFKEQATCAFFIITGYKFRPAPDNPYLQVPQDDEDEEVEMDEVVTKSGAFEGITRVNKGKSSSDDTTELTQRESSHEYD